MGETETTRRERADGQQPASLTASGWVGRTTSFDARAARNDAIIAEIHRDAARVRERREAALREIMAR